MKLELTKRKAMFLETAIHTWVARELISKEEGLKLLQSIAVIPFDWKRLAKYSFWIAMICIVISVGAILADEVLMELLAAIFKLPASIKCLFFALTAAILYYYGFKRTNTKPERVFSNEAVFFLGVLSTATAILFFGAASDMASGHFSILLLLASVIYGVLGLWFPSNLIWIFALLSLGSWFGAKTGYMSGWGAYYLGMNYPLRFVLIGIAVIACSHLFNLLPGRREFVRPTRAVGLLYLFVALWIMSIFGNYGDVEEWQSVKQIELFHWSVLFGLASFVAIIHGLKKDDGMTRGFGIVFLIINLYTRFFEYFWDSIHKAAFFALLAVSFWYLGSRAERVWTVGTTSREQDGQEY